jgi:hypothetical protein
MAVRTCHQLWPVEHQSDPNSSVPGSLPTFQKESDRPPDSDLPLCERPAEDVVEVPDQEAEQEQRASCPEHTQDVLADRAGDLPGVVWRPADEVRDTEAGQEDQGREHNLVVDRIAVFVARASQFVRYLSSKARRTRWR